MRIINIGGEPYEIQYGQNAICALEDEVDDSIINLIQRLEKGTKLKFSDLRAIVWAGMLNKRRSITPEAVGALCDDAGVSVRAIAMECVSELVDSFRRYILLDDGKGDAEKNE